MPVLQKFTRQAQENSLIPQWADEIPASEIPDEDPDDEDNLPIPAAEVPAAGKPRARRNVRPQPDDDSDECEVVEPLEAEPIAYAMPPPVLSPNPIHSAPSDAAGPQGASRKRAGTDPADAGASAPGVKKPKLQKKAAVKSRQLPTTTE